MCVFFQQCWILFSLLFQVMVTERLETSPAAGPRSSVHPGKSFKPVMPVCYIYCYFSNVLHSSLSLLCIMSGVLIGIFVCRRRVIWHVIRTFGCEQSLKHKAWLNHENWSTLSWYLLPLTGVLSFVNPVNANKAWLCWASNVVFHSCQLTSWELITHIMYNKLP